MWGQSLLADPPPYRVNPSCVAPAIVPWRVTSVPRRALARVRRALDRRNLDA
ncbi:hypothetical protein OIU91_39245 [Streptomyces sp. NBC_01456]|uniref:hypothetical protein n=1 Tax=unclassified Streptomyces TaxID=2593676 RepID=UPI002E2FD997|nr:MULTISPECIES: hypothetical protein [unclassified Streptomyces]